MKSILILDAFITDEADENLLINFIDNIKSLGDDVLLMSNTTISKKVQDKVNYLFYDKRNQLFEEEYDNHRVITYYTHHGEFKVTNIFPHPQPHGLSVLISLFRSVKIAKDLGYTHFYKMEYDAILGKESKEKIKELNETCIVNGKKGVFFTDRDCVEAHYFFSEIDFFLNNFWNISCEQDYINYLDHEKGNRDFVTMEEFMYENLIKSNISDLHVYEELNKLLSDTHLNTKHTKAHYDEKFKDCFTRFYLVKDKSDKIAIYSVNKKTNSDFRKIIVIFNDGNQIELKHEFWSHGSWVYTMVDNNVEKMMVYDQEDSFLYEEYFKDIKNIIEFY